MTSPRHRKRQHKNHIAGRKGVDLVKNHLPDYWVIRELNPDYGLDIHVEAFDLLPDGSGSADTLGEHFYAQVKGVQGGVTKIVKTVGHRKNVAKFDVVPGVEEHEVEFEVVTFSLDTNELLTVESMGAAVPAVLFVADLDAGDVYFVCLNDYISKILLPESPDYTNQASHTIHLPTWNVLDSADNGFVYFWLLARRGKYYAAFNTFVYQWKELSRAASSPGAIAFDPTTDRAQISPDILKMLGVFLRGDLRLDIWEPAGPGVWPPLDDVRASFEQLDDALAHFGRPRPVEEVDSFKLQIDWCFGSAVNLGSMYEELVREWRLPTALAVMTDDSEASKYRPVDRRKPKSAEG